MEVAMMKELAEQKPFASGLNFYKLFWIFFIGCFCGVFVETIWCFITRHHFESRVGVIYGPFNPVYGVGALLLTLCLYKLSKKRDLWIFLGSMIIGGLFEFLSSFLQELTFKTVSWEYSNAQQNLFGRTNFLFAFFWGILGLLWVKDVYPKLSDLIEKIPRKPGIILTWVLLTLMVLNITISALAVGRQTERREGKPATNAISRFLDEKYTDDYLKNIYPNMSVANEKEYT
jgi:uncharacterized membrane protein